MITPAPGIYPNVPDEAYRRGPGWGDCLSYSGAKSLLRTAKHYREVIDNPPPATPATEMGTDVHTRILLGKEAFDRLYLALPEGLDCRRTADRKTRDELREQAESEGMLIRPAATIALIESLAAAVEMHPLAMGLIEGADIEVSMRWDDPASNAACKGRVDAYRPDVGAVIDLKSCIDASPAAFARQALNYGYGIQSAAYLDGLRTLGHPAESFIFVCIEKAAPHGCAVYSAPAALIELGARRWAEACARFAECTASGEWPGYSSDLQELELPGWALRELFTDDTEQDQ